MVGLTPAASPLRSGCQSWGKGLAHEVKPGGNQPLLAFSEGWRPSAPLQSIPPSCISVTSSWMAQVWCRADSATQGQLHLPWLRA